MLTHCIPRSDPRLIVRFKDARDSRGQFSRIDIMSAIAHHYDERRESLPNVSAIGDASLDFFPCDMERFAKAKDVGGLLSVVSDNWRCLLHTNKPWSPSPCWGSFNPVSSRRLLKGGAAVEGDGSCGALLRHTSPVSTVECRRSQHANADLHAVWPKHIGRRTPYRVSIPYCICWVQFLTVR